MAQSLKTTDASFAGEAHCLNGTGLRHKSGVTAALVSCSSSGKVLPRVTAGPDAPPQAVVPTTPRAWLKAFPAQVRRPGTPAMPETNALSRYRLVARLGSGGMAEVYLAVSEGPHGFSKLQVLKMLRPDLNDDERAEFVQMFQDEGRLAARLNHPNIVQSHDVGFEAAQPFIAMEYLEGQPLSRVQERIWKQEAELSWGLHLFPICQVLDALDYAHGLTDYDGTPLHIVHRDVSPQNVFVTYTGHTKLVDFGIAKTLESCKTRAGVVKGKVPYMSPEQVVGQPVDHRTDLFSVGVILWETIAQRPMHGSEPMFQILSRVVRGELPDIQQVAPSTPSALCAIVRRALALEPADRYPSAVAFRNDLDRFVQEHGRASANEVGLLVSELFATERKEVREAIRSAMARPNTEAAAWDRDTLRLPPTLSMLTSRTQPSPTAEPMALAPVSARTAHSDAALAVPRSTHAEIEQVPDTAPYEQNNTAKPVHRDTQAIMAQPKSSIPLFAVAATLAALSLGFWLTREKPPEPSLSAGADAQLAPATVVSGNGAAVQAEAQTLPARPQEPAAATHSTTATAVQLQARVEPASAVLLLDGEVLGHGSFQATRPVDSAVHTLVARAPGFVTQSHEVKFDRDVELTLRLAPAPRASRAGANPSPTTARAASVPVPVSQPATPARRPDPYDKDFAPSKRSQPAPLEDPF